MNKLKDACQNDWLIVMYIAVLIFGLLALGLNLAHYPVGGH